MHNFFIFLDIRLEACSFTKNEPVNRYFFKVFWLQFHLATLRAAIFKNTSFSQNLFNGYFHYTLFSCSMIQKIMRELIKLETAYLLHGQCFLFAHIFITRNFKKIQNNIKHIVLLETCPKFRETHPSRKRLSYAPE